MGYIGFGILLKRGNGASPEQFTAIAELIGLAGPTLSRETVDVTHTESTNKYREFIAGLLDAGEVTVDVAWLPDHATQNEATGILKDLHDGTLRNFQIIWPTAAPVTWTIACLVTGVDPTAPIEDRMTASISLKVSGDPTLA